MILFLKLISFFLGGVLVRIGIIGLFINFNKYPEDLSIPEIIREAEQRNISYFLVTILGVLVIASIFIK